MTVEKLTLPDDIGSLVVREIIRQLNRSYSTVTVPTTAQAGTLVDGVTSYDISAGAAAIGCIVFVAKEDCYIIGCDVFSTAAWDNDTGMVLDVLLATENTPVAPDPGTNGLLFASDGTGPLVAAGTLTDLATLTAVDTNTGLDANAFTTVTGAHAAIAPTDFRAGYRLNAGEKLRFLITELGGAAEGTSLHIHYRPIKDEIDVVGGVATGKYTGRRDR